MAGKGLGGHAGQEHARIGSLPHVTHEVTGCGLKPRHVGEGESNRSDLVPRVEHKHGDRGVVPRLRFVQEGYRRRERRVSRERVPGGGGGLGEELVPGDTVVRLVHRDGFGICNER